MNCQELKQDIEKLEDLYSRFKNKYELSSESGLGKIELTNILNEANESVDEILERYLPDFKEHNPELTKWQLSERIEGLKSIGIICVSALPDGSALIGGENGTLCHIEKDKDGDWVLKKKITDLKNPNDELFGCGISSICVFQDGSALIGGDNRVLYYATKQGEDWSLEFIRGLEDYECYGGVSDSVDILSICALPDGSALICGTQELLYCATKNGEKWNLQPIVKNKGNWSHSQIHSVCTLPDGSALVAGSYDDVLFHITKKSDEEWELSDNLIKGRTNNIEEEFFDIRTITSLPNGEALLGDYAGHIYCVTNNQDGSFQIDQIEGPEEIESCFVFQAVPSPSGGGVLIGGRDGQLYYAKKNSEGKWDFEFISGFKSKNNQARAVYAITALPDGSALVGGGEDLLFHATPPVEDVKTLKMRLGKMINKNSHAPSKNPQVRVGIT